MQFDLSAVLDALMECRDSLENLATDLDNLAAIIPAAPLAFIAIPSKDEAAHD